MTSFNDVKVGDILYYPVAGSLSDLLRDMGNWNV